MYSPLDEHPAGGPLEHYAHTERHALRATEFITIERTSECLYSYDKNFPRVPFRAKAKPAWPGKVADGSDGRLSFALKEL